MPTNFDCFAKKYRVYMCTPMSFTGSAPAFRAGVKYNRFYPTIKKSECLFRVTAFVTFFFSGNFMWSVCKLRPLRVG